MEHQYVVISVSHRHSKSDCKIYNEEELRQAIKDEIDKNVNFINNDDCFFRSTSGNEELRNQLLTMDHEHADIENMIDKIIRLGQDIMERKAGWFWQYVFRCREPKTWP